MNELLHFFTGYLIALVYLKPKDQKKGSYWSFGAFVGGVSGLLPDMAELFADYGHATWSHTIIFASLLAVGLASLLLLFAKDLLSHIGFKSWKLFNLTWLAAMSHLFLDIFTHQKFQCAEAERDLKHIYFWPLWGQTFHMDCLFGWSYLVRILVEWVIYLPIVIAILFYRKRKYGENPFACLNYQNWDRITDPQIQLSETIAAEKNAINRRVLIQKKILAVLFYLWILTYAVNYLFF